MQILFLWAWGFFRKTPFQQRPLFPDPDGSKTLLRSKARDCAGGVPGEILQSARVASFIFLLSSSADVDGAILAMMLIADCPLETPERPKNQSHSKVGQK